MLHTKGNYNHHNSHKNAFITIKQMYNDVSDNKSQNNMNMEQKVEQMANTLKIIEQQLEQTIKSQEHAIRVRADMQNAIESAKQIKDNEKNTTTESLQPHDIHLSIGGGMFVSAKVSASNKILLDIGSGVMIEKDLEYALNYFENNIREIEIVIKNTDAERQKLVHYVEQYRMQLNQAVQSMYGVPGTSGNV